NSSAPDRGSCERRVRQRRAEQVAPRTTCGRHCSLPRTRLLRELSLHASRLQRCYPGPATASKRATASLAVSAPEQRTATVVLSLPGLRRAASGRERQARRRETTCKQCARGR